MYFGFPLLFFFSQQKSQLIFTFYYTLGVSQVLNTLDAKDVGKRHESKRHAAEDTILQGWFIFTLAVVRFLISPVHPRGTTDTAEISLYKSKDFQICVPFFPLVLLQGRILQDGSDKKKKKKKHSRLNKKIVNFQ